MVTARELIKLLEANGWKHVRTSKHIVYKKEGVDHLISVPAHGNRDIAKGTLERILKTAGIQRKD